MLDDVALNKTAIIKRCMKRVAEEYGGTPARLENYTIQDSIILNIQRACEAAIDLAMHVVAKRNLGVPQDSRSGFDLLREAKLIDADLAERLKRMVGFRNIAVHNYQVIQFDILQAIIEKRLGDFEEFTDAVQKFLSV
jgi:uncharacterized protein YutE (UPF0331/DUF86 family)